MDHDDDFDLSSRLAALEAHAPATATPPALPSRRRRGRFAVSMAMAPVLVLAIVATTAASAYVVANLAQEHEGIQNPGQPLAGAHMECMSPPEAHAFLAERGFGSGRLAGRDRHDGRARRRQGNVDDGPPGDTARARLRHPRLAARRRHRDHGRRPADRRDGRGRLLRGPDAMTSVDATAAVRVDRAAATKGDPEAFEAAVRPHYAPLIRRLVLVLGDPHDAEDIAQDAYLSRAFRGVGPLRRHRTSGRWLYTDRLRGWRSITVAAVGAGWPRSAGSRPRPWAGPVRPRTSGPPSCDA